MLWLEFDVESPLCVCHHCDVRLCFNPAHLFIGTRAINNADRGHKGRGRESRQQGEDNLNAKLSTRDVREIIRLGHEGMITQTAIAKRFGVRQGYVSKILSGRNWRHLWEE
jgi:hypothetical protein